MSGERVIEINDRGILVGASVITAIELLAEAEQVKGYWDNKGLDMHIAVKLDGRVAVSTKHWGRVHYIVCEGKKVSEMWDAVKLVAGAVGRSLVRSDLGPYVYIPKLNIGQTQDIFNKLKRRLRCYKIQRKFGFSWNIDDAVLDDYSDEEESDDN